jgi:5'-nucleotidase (lipoprotein e(P4) family)
MKSETVNPPTLGLYVCICVAATFAQPLAHPIAHSHEQPPSPHRSNATETFKAEVPSFRGLDANLYMQTSAEYRAACYQAYHVATWKLRESVKAHSANVQDPKTHQLAVVMDLDETVVDNAGFQTWMLRTGRAYDQAWFDRWEQDGGEYLQLLPGAKEFIHTAQSLGVTVVHISNRNEMFRDATKKSLVRLGIPISAESELKLSTDTSNKTTRRLEVEKIDGLEVVLHVGDNLRDFDERFRCPDLNSDATTDQIRTAIAHRKEQVDLTRDNWGSKWIVIPNPAYGEWMKPLGRGENDLHQLSRVGTPLGMAFWNVENLFDTEDDPTVEGDEEFTPSGPNQWTDERLQIKLGNLAAVIGRMHDGKGPVVLGLAEVENRAVVEMLVDRLKPLGRNYQIIHQDSPSGRGIDCALIYDANIMECVDAKFHHVDAENTREIVEAKLSHKQSVITVFVNHWPSRAHETSFRIKAATVLRTRIDELLREDALADVIAMGDFNDHPEDESMMGTLGAINDVAKLKGGKLLNTSFEAEPDASSGTYVYDNRWEILDQILVSPGLLVPGGISWGIGSTRPVVLADDQLYHPSGDGIARPSRSYSRTTFHKNGYSDHLPVVTTIYCDQP